MEDRGIGSSRGLRENRGRRAARRPRKGRAASSWAAAKTIVRFTSGSTVAAGVPGFIGFAVGRTDFWEPLVAWRAGQISREAAVAEIARRYREFADIFMRGQGREADISYGIGDSTELSRHSRRESGIKLCNSE